jgi:hypothetical protein
MSFDPCRLTLENGWCGPVKNLSSSSPHLKTCLINTQNCNFTCFIWMWNCSRTIREGQADSVRNQDGEENFRPERESRTFMLISFKSFIREMLIWSNQIIRWLVDALLVRKTKNWSENEEGRYQVIGGRLLKKKLNSVAWVRERPLLVYEVSVNFCG